MYVYITVYSMCIIILAQIVIFIRGDHIHICKSNHINIIHMFIYIMYMYMFICISSAIAIAL